MTVAWSNFGQIIEVNEAKQTVWKVETEAGAGLSRSRWITELP